MTNRRDENSAAPGRDRRSARLFAADLVVKGLPDQRIVIKDVSARGCGARAEQIPVVGTMVRISLPGVGWVEGSVAWIDKGRFGVLFSHPLDVKAAIRGGKPSSAFAVKDTHKPPKETKRPGLGIKIDC